MATSAASRYCCTSTSAARPRPASGWPEIYREGARRMTISASPSVGTDVAAVQRRTLRVLLASQVLAGAGLAAGVTVGALLAQEMLRSTSLSGLPAGLMTLGSAGAAMGVGRLSQRWG